MQLMQVAQDNQVDVAICKWWILGWLYESYNNVKKTSPWDSGDKTGIQQGKSPSQVYTPRWVVEF
jgi:hypothetical protein